MIFFLLLFVVCCLWGCNIQSKMNKEYLSFESTQAIKGIFILLVFFSHFNSYVTFSTDLDIFASKIISLFGQTMVTLFLLYSGYGVMESIKKKGKAYVKTFPVKRILATLFRFDCAVLIFVVIALLITKQPITIKTVILSFIGWESVGNSNWYVFVVILLYIFTYIAFVLPSKKGNTYSTSIVLLLTCMWIMACVLFKIRPRYWYDTSLCYCLGMYYSIYKEKVELLVESLIKWSIAFGCMILLFLLFREYKANGICNMLMNISFALIVVLLTMRVKVGNKVLIWCGKHLFELYILQRIPMILLSHFNIHEFNLYMYFVLCMVITLLLVYPFKMIVDGLWKKIQFKFDSYGL